MSQLDPSKLSIQYTDSVDPDQFSIPRVYTLTHSDFTGDLYLTIGRRVEAKQISGLYTRFMRDEVWAEWISDPEPLLRVHCHVSGGIVLGSASWRYALLQTHMPMVLEAIRYGDSSIGVHVARQCCLN